MPGRQSAPDDRRKATAEQQRLIIDHVEFAGQIASVFQRQYRNWIARDDLRSIAYEALCNAALTFDATRGASFKTHAWRLIRAAFIQEIRTRYGRTGINRPQRIPARLICSLELVEWDEEAADDPESDEIEEIADREALEILIAALPERERLVVTLWTYENLTHRQIGEVLGVTESRACQIFRRACERLRPRLAAQRYPGP